MEWAQQKKESGAAIQNPALGLNYKEAFNRIKIAYLNYPAFKIQCL